MGFWKRFSGRHRDGYVVALITLCVCSARPASGLIPIDGTWIDPSPGLWSDTANWDGGSSPNVRGLAVFADALTTGGDVEIDINISLRQLDLDTIQNLTFVQDAGMNGSLTLQGNGGDAAINAIAGLHTLGLDTTIATNLIINNTSGNDFDINAAISGAHAVTYDGPSRTEINAAQSYTGGSTVNGLLSVNANGSLVGTGNITVGPTGELRVNESPGSDAALNAVDANSVVLNGGRLRINTDAPIADYLHNTSTGGTILLGANNTNDLNLTRTFDGAVTNDSDHVLLSNGGGSHTMSGTLSFDAATTTRQLRLASESGTLTIASDLLAANNIDSVKVEHGSVSLSGINTYAGQTIVEGGTLTVRNSAALGTGDGTDTSGTLVRNHSTLYFNNGHLGTIANEKLTLEAGTLRFGDFSSGSLTLGGPIAVLNDPCNLFDVRQNFTLNIVGGVTSEGLTTLDSTGNVNVNSAWNHTGTLRLRNFGSGVLDINSSVAVDGAIHFGGRQNAGNTQVDGTVTADTIVFDGGWVWGGGTIAGSDSTTLDLRSGFINFAGTLTGVTEAVKTTVGRFDAVSYGATAPNLDITVEQGLYRHRGTITNVNSPINITGSVDAVLEVDGLITQDINLNNSAGFNWSGALIGRNNSGSTITGDVDLGGTGSYIGGGFRPLTLAGNITGGFLHVVGDEKLSLTGTLAHTGDTIIGLNGVGHMLVVNGTDISSSPTIHVNRNAAVRVNPGALAASGDVEIDGGWLLFSDSGTVNHVDLVAGHASVAVVPGESATLASLTRADHATATFFASNDRTLGGVGGDDPRLFISGQSNGFIGGWAVVGNSTTYSIDFADYDTVEGVRALDTAGRPDQIEGAVLTDNVLITTGAVNTLTSDTTINSLQANINIPPASTTTVDLGGNRLTVTSGGLIRQSNGGFEITHGELTVGDGVSNGDLYAFVRGTSPTQISADIVDNGSSQVALTVSGTSRLELSGDNSYSGPTTINGRAYYNTAQLDDLPVSLRLMNADALPTDGDVNVNGGRFETGFAAAGALDLGTLTLREGGIVIAGNSYSVWQPHIDADAYALESGAIYADVSGSGTMTKSTIGTVTLEGDYTGYAGNIVVNEGTLNTEQDLGDATITVFGGRLTGSFQDNSANAVTVSNDITLDGGELGVGTSGTLHVMQDATLLTYNVLYNPGESLMLNADPAAIDLVFSGDVILDSGVTLVARGSGTAQFTGTLTIGDATTIDLENQSVALVDTIASGGASSVVNFNGIRCDDVNANRYVASVGESLTLLFDGINETLTLGANQSASGSGTLMNALTVAGGGAIAPGASVGSLTVDADVEFAGGGRFEFEIGRAFGAAGSDWDELLVTNTLNLTATALDPITIDLLAFGDMLTEQSDLPVIEWEFASAKQIIGFDADAFVVDAASLVGATWGGALFEVRQVDESLVLRMVQPIEKAIPTPSSLAMLAVGVLALGRRRYTRLKRTPTY